MRTALTLVGFALAAYAAVVLLFYLKQGALLYPASTERTSAAQAGLSGFEDVVLRTPDGESIVGWYKGSPGARSSCISTATAAASSTAPDAPQS